MVASMRRILAPLLLAAVAAAGSHAATTLRGLSYAGGADAERSLDLYLPDPADEAPPLVAFVYSGFWSRADRGRVVESGVARALQSEGVAVAVIRHRLAPRHRHPAFVEDAARAVAWLVENADAHGYDADRLFLAGHSSGAQIAALLALDPRHLEAAGVAPQAIAGVIAVSGVYELEPGELPEALEELAGLAFADARARREASPVRHARAEAAPFLVLAARNDVPGLAAAGARFSLALREAGHPSAETFVANGRDHLSILDLSDLRNPARQHVLAFLGLSQLPGEMAELYEGRRHWRAPAVSTEPFWESGASVRSHPVDERFLIEVNRTFASRGGPPRLRPARFHAVDLFGYLDALGTGATGSGRYLVLENARGERSVWDLEAIRAYRPVVVVGLDEEKNLFRLVDVYHTEREYTWRGQPERKLLARPLGAFLYFLDEPPEPVGPAVFGRFGLVPDGFRLEARDPLARLRDLPEPLFELLTRDKACVSCHSFHGVGARAGHIRLRDGERVGGFALPLEEYPAEVWRRYVFEQGDVAREIGATPVDLDETVKSPLYEAVIRARE
jgi:acetyl esterase/lipase